MRANDSAFLFGILLILHYITSFCASQVFDGKMGGGNSEAQQAHESREKLRHRYRELVLEANPKDRVKNRQQLQDEVMDFVCSVPVFILRLCHISLEVFNKNREERNWHLRDASKALVVIERFALNLWDYPWKEELRFIKQYTGIYQGHIERYLKGSELYFRLIGYEALPGRILKLDHVRKDQVADAAFETYLDCAYFSYLGDIQDLLQNRGFNLLQVWNAREKFVGTPKEIASRMQGETKPALRVDMHANLMDIDVEIPKDAGPEKASAAAAAIKQEKAPGKDSGYISKPASREVPPEELAEMQKQTKQEATKRKAAEAKNIENLSKQLGNLTQQHTELYEPATIDEHVGMSLRAVQERDEDDTSREAEDKSTDESWGFVNEELQSRKMQGHDVTQKATDEGRPACLRLNTFCSMPSAGPMRNTRPKPNGLHNNVAVAMESPTDADLWAASPPLENRKPLVQADPENLDTPQVKYLLEDAMGVAKPSQKTPLEFSTFGKDANNQQPSKRSRPLPYGPAGLGAAYTPYGEIQSDSADHDDKVGQILWKTEQELDETLQKSPRSSLRGDQDYFSLPSAPTSNPEPAPPRRTTTKDITAKREAARRMQQRMSPLSVNAPWQCKTCTFINTELKMVCQVCGKSRDLSSDLTALRSGTPQCKKCTLVNEEGGTHCKACGEPLKGCPTYF